MKTFTRIVLPIVLVAGVVFGITFITVYSPDEDRPDAGAPSKGTGTQGLPLKFGVVRAATPREEHGEQGPAPLAAHLRHLKYWNSDLEVGAPGHYDFWCQNRHDQPVTVRVSATNCQCAGVEFAAVAPDAYRDYAVGSALAGGPLCPAPGPVAVLAHLALRQRLTWETLYQEGEQHDRTVPAAAPGRAQFALVRLGWSGKAIGPKNINADLFANLPNGTPAHQRLDADVNVVPAFDTVRRTGPSQWALTREVPVGDLREDAVATQEFFLASSTRAHPVYQVTGDPTDPCVTWTQPVPADPDEVASLHEYVARLESREGSVRPPKSLYKVRVTVRERAGDRRLDLGPLDRRLTASAAGGGEVLVGIRGRVFGEVTILSGAESGKADLGTSFPADRDQSKAVDLAVERPGVELTLLEAETAPNYLKVKLEKLPPTGDGRNRYRLRITVPKGSLYGALPDTSAVVLQTTGPNPRRFRLPVRGMTYDSGGPRL